MYLSSCIITTLLFLGPSKASIQSEMQAVLNHVKTFLPACIKIFRPTWKKSKTIQPSKLMTLFLQNVDQNLLHFPHKMFYVFGMFSSFEQCWNKIMMNSLLQEEGNSNPSWTCAPLALSLHWLSYHQPWIKIWNSITIISQMSLSATKHFITLYMYLFN